MLFNFKWYIYRRKTIFLSKGRYKLIDFNIPPYVGKEKEYINKAIDSRKICGDGQYTKKCH